MNQAKHWTVSEAQYNEDREFVRSSGLKVAVRSPRLYEALYVSGTIVDTFTKAKLLGSVTHCLAIEGEEEFGKRYALRPPGLKGTDKAGREALAKWKLDSIHKIMLEEAVTDVAGFMEQAWGMVNAIRADDFIQEIMASATKEMALVWTDDETGLPCKLRTDLWVSRANRDTDLILDIKTSDDPSPENWSRGGAFCPIVKYGYDLSGAHYVDGWYRFTGRKCDYGLIVVGSSKPHDVYLYDLTGWLEVGENKRRKALRTVARGLKENNWRRPCQSGVITLKPSKWDLEDDE